MLLLLPMLGRQHRSCRRPWQPRKRLSLAQYCRCDRPQPECRVQPTITKSWLASLLRNGCSHACARAADHPSGRGNAANQAPCTMDQTGMHMTHFLCMIEQDSPTLPACVDRCNF